MAESTKFDIIEAIDEDFDAININAAPKFPAREHAQYVAKQLGVSEGLIYLVGRPSKLYEDSDQPTPFRQRRYFFYMSGANFEDAVVTYDIKLDSLCLFIPEINPKTVIWIGPTPTPAECRAKYDVDSVLFTSQLSEYVMSWEKKNHAGKLYALHENQAPRHLIITGQLMDFTVLQPAMDAARVIKSDYEIAQIRQANEISAHAHRNVLKSIKKLKNESEVEAIFGGTCVAKKAKQQAYGIIAASGVNASTLHYVDNDQDLEGRQLICIDAGAEWNCYASDVTRTFPLSGSFTTEAKAIYDIVDGMQTQCIHIMKPGVEFYELVTLSQEIAIKGLMKLGVLRNGSFDEIKEAGTIRAFFPHGLGHHLGLEVHDVAGGDTLYMARELVEEFKCDFGMNDDNWTVLTPEVRLASLREHPHSGSVHAKRVAIQSKYIDRRGYRGPPMNSFLMPGNSEQENQSGIGHRRKLEVGMVVTIEPGIYFSKFALESLYLKHEVHSKYINADLLEK